MRTCESLVRQNFSIDQITILENQAVFYNCESLFIRKYIVSNTLCDNFPSLKVPIPDHLRVTYFKNCVKPKSSKFYNFTSASVING